MPGLEALEQLERSKMKQLNMQEAIKRIGLDEHFLAGSDPEAASGLPRRVKSFTDLLCASSFVIWVCSVWILTSYSTISLFALSYIDMALLSC